MGMSAETAAMTGQFDWSKLIVAVATDQDREAFGLLFAHFAPRIKTYMIRAGANEAAAEELAQETMLSVWRKAGLFDPMHAGASGWIFAIARNLRIDAFRRQHRGGAVEVSDAEAEYQVDDAPAPDAMLIAAQSETRVRAALKALPPDQLRVVELSFFADKAHGDIAEILDLPLGTVKSRLRLAINRLRNLLGHTA